MHTARSTEARWSFPRELWAASDAGGLACATSIVNAVSSKSRSPNDRLSGREEGGGRMGEDWNDGVDNTSTGDSSLCALDSGKRRTAAAFLNTTKVG